MFTWRSWEHLQSNFNGQLQQGDGCVFGGKSTREWTDNSDSAVWWEGISFPSTLLIKKLTCSISFVSFAPWISQNCASQLVFWWHVLPSLRRKNLILIEPNFQFWKLKNITSTWQTLFNSCHITTTIVLTNYIPKQICKFLFCFDLCRII